MSYIILRHVGVVWFVVHVLQLVLIVENNTIVVALTNLGCNTNKTWIENQIFLGILMVIASACFLVMYLNM